jgi:hypothetical protein
VLALTPWHREFQVSGSRFERIRFMRRLAIVIAIVGLSASAPAWADPFANLSNSLDHYDRQLEKRNPAPANRSATAAESMPVRQASAQGPMRPQQYRRPAPVSAGPVRQMQRPVRQTQATVRQAQAAGREVIQPEPMPQDQFLESGGDFYPGEVWEEPMMGDCTDGSCNMGCGWCKPGFWGRAEYLMWWVRGAYVPPLVTTSPQGTPVGQAGVLPNADILFGDQQINTRGRSGGRFTIGYWFDPCETLGIENTFFFIGGDNQGYTTSSSGDPILARPFTNVNTGNQDSIVLAYPQVVVGGINITSSRQVYSNEINLRRSLYSDCWRRIDVLAGYRYMRLGESLNISTNSTSLDSSTLGTQFAVQDMFSTGNNFNGGQIGVNMQLYRGCWTIDLLGKIALGGVSQQARINGSTVITPVDEAIQTYNGGILALPSNSGQFNQTVFGAVPEFGVNLRYQWTPLWRVSVGYTIMALTNVLRPGDQIDLNIDPSQFPPGTAGTSPVYKFNQSDLWLQGINLGVECNF